MNKKEDFYKISVPIIDNFELEEWDRNISNNYESIFDEIAKNVSKEREILALKRVIKYQHDKIKKLEKLLEDK